MRPIIPPVRLNKPNHNKRETIVLIAVLILLLIGIGASLLLTLQSKPISIQKKAQEISNTETNALVCPDEGATCSWDSQGDATISYSYEVIDQTEGTTVKTGTTQDIEVTFTPIINHAYECTVKAVNQCGEGPSSSAVNTCGETATPTPAEISTETPISTNEIEPTAIQESVPTEVPTPTVEIIISSTPTPTPTESVVVQISPTETPTATLSPTPLPPTSGSNTGILFMVVSTVILVSLMVVF